MGKLSHGPQASTFEGLVGAEPGPEQSRDAFNPNHATARLSQRKAKLKHDFVLLVKTSTGPNISPRAVLAPANDFGHAALMLTVQPSKLFPDVQGGDEFDGEIIFLADQSASMRGKKTDTLRDALVVFLKSLPVTC